MLNVNTFEVRLDSIVNFFNSQDVSYLLRFLTHRWNSSINIVLNWSTSEKTLAYMRNLRFITSFNLEIIWILLNCLQIVFQLTFN
jgi:hypothetical protein